MASSSVGGVRISHPDRVIYPDLGFSKIQLARYFERIGEWILPHVVGEYLVADSIDAVISLAQMGITPGTRPLAMSIVRTV